MKKYISHCQGQISRASNEKVNGYHFSQYLDCATGYGRETLSADITEGGENISTYEY